ncbi:MAG: peptidase A24 [Firmicutes bacterium]|nr:peptidase A24 [Bacillota bacterium]
MLVRYSIALLVASIAAYTDLKTRRISNWLTFAGMVSGISINLWGKGFPGLVFSIEGILVGIVLLFVPFTLGGIGAGDVKLLGALGALIGPREVFSTALCGAIAGGIIASVILVIQGRFLITLRAIVFGFISLFLPGMSAVYFRDFLQEIGKNPAVFPYSLAIGSGVALNIILNYLNLLGT